MEFFSSRRLTRIGVSAALYVVATLLCAPLAYEAVQFRVSEMLMLLCFYSKDYILSMTIGCFIANLFSSLGMADMLFGTSATLIAAVLIYAFRNRTNLFVASLFPVAANALIIGAELKFIFGDPFWVNAAYVALGEFVCITVLGVTVFRLLEKNKRFMKIITAS
ncbi:MAG: QueT transporter family protein [Ruminococcus sp.]|nr:QueT transporter family protein [Ruminococcus sp.]